MKILKWCRVVLPAACLCAAGAARAATLTAGPFAVEVSPVLTVRCHDELLFSGERCGVFPNPRSPATPWIDVAAVGKVVRQDNCLTVSAQNGRNSFRREVLVTPEAVHVTFEMKAFGQTGGTAVALSAIAFASAHAGQGLAFLPLFPLALVLGLIAERTGSIVPSVLLHAMFNAVSVFILLAQPGRGAATG